MTNTNTNAKIWRHWPLALTWSRIAVLPLLAAAFWWPGGSEAARGAAAAAVFSAAAATDFLDGFLARRHQLQTQFGAFLDPVADKLLVVSALLLLLSAGYAHPAAVLIIVGREIFISGLREWMAAVGARDAVAVAWPGKIKTAAQMGGIILLFYNAGQDGALHNLAQSLLWLAVALTLFSMAGYVRSAWRRLKSLKD